MKTKKHLTGFSLIELMVTLSVVALLMAYAIPNYRDYVLRSKRTEAMNDLMQVSHMQERHYANKNRYGSAEELKLEQIFPVPNASNERVYTITMEANNTSFLATAKPHGTQTQDSQCPTFSINHLGKKVAADGCWN